MSKLFSLGVGQESPIYFTLKNGLIVKIWYSREKCKAHVAKCNSAVRAVVRKEKQDDKAE